MSQAKDEKPTAPPGPPLEKPKQAGAAGRGWWMRVSEGLAAVWRLLLSIIAPPQPAPPSRHASAAPQPAPPAKTAAERPAAAPPAPGAAKLDPPPAPPASAPQSGEAIVAATLVTPPPQPAAAAPITPARPTIRPSARRQARKPVDPQWQPAMRVFAPHAFETQVKIGRAREGLKLPKIVLSELAHDKAVHYVDIAAEEVGWLGTVAALGGGRYLIKDLWLFDQQVHGATTRIGSDGLAAFMEEHRNTPEGDDIWENTRFWGHSHHNMGVSPSTRDDDQMEEFRSCGQDYFIRGIFNKHGKIKFDFFDFEHGVVFEDVPWEKLDTVDPELRAEIVEAFQDHVHPMRGGVFGARFAERPAAKPAAAAAEQIAQAEPARAAPAAAPPCSVDKTETPAPGGAPQPKEGSDSDDGIESAASPGGIQPRPVG